MVDAETVMDGGRMGAERDESPRRRAAWVWSGREVKVSRRAVWRRRNWSRASWTEEDGEEGGMEDAVEAREGSRIFQEAKDVRRSAAGRDAGFDGRQEREGGVRVVAVWMWFRRRFRPC